MNTYEIFGGWNYAGSIDLNVETLQEAAGAWYDRYSSNGWRFVDGVLWPCFGVMSEDDIAVLNPGTEEYLTRAEVIALFE